MTQVFKGDIVENKFIDAFRRIIKQTDIDLRNFSDEAYQSVLLGNVLYELKAIPVYNILQKSLFLRVWSQIVDVFPRCGTFNAYCDLIYALFGSQAYIEVDADKPLNLKLSVVANLQTLTFWTTKDTGELIVTQSGENIEFKSFQYSVSNKEIFNMIYEMTNAGTNIDIIFNLTDKWTQPKIAENGEFGVSRFAVESEPASPDVWHAFDGSDQTTYDAEGTSGSITFYNHNFISVSSIAIVGGVINSVIISGSKDFETWDRLKEYTNTDPAQCLVQMDDNPNFYRYYKIEWLGESTKISEIKITALGVSDEEYVRNVYVTLNQRGDSYNYATFNFEAGHEYKLSVVYANNGVGLWVGDEQVTDETLVDGMIFYHTPQAETAQIRTTGGYSYIRIQELKQ